MKKYLLMLLFIALPVGAATPVERLLMAQDYEAWLNGGKSLLDWGSYGGKDIKTLPGIKQPVHVYMDFKSNSIAAEDKYKGMQRVTGHVSAIERDYNGEPRLLFRVGSFDRLYAYGLTKNEIVKLKVPDKVDLQCMDFHLNSVGDIVGSCSMILDKNQSIAINTIQSLDKKGKLQPLIKSNKKLDVIMSFFNEDVKNTINKECIHIDSTNIARCYVHMENLFDEEKIKKAKQVMK